MINWTQELQDKSPQGAMEIFQLLTDGYMVRKSKHFPMMDKICLDDPGNTTNGPQKTFSLD